MIVRMTLLFDMFLLVSIFNKNQGAGGPAGPLEGAQKLIIIRMVGKRKHYCCWSELTVVRNSGSSSPYIL